MTSNRILTTHVGALPLPSGVSLRSLSAPEVLRDAVRDVVAEQKQAGIDIFNEGEHTKGGNFVEFVNSRLSGFEPAPGEATAQLLWSSEDWTEFRDFYESAFRRGILFEDTEPEDLDKKMQGLDWVCVGPIEYCGQAGLQTEIDLLRAALGDAPASQAFLTSTAPASIEPGRVNKYYKSDEDYIYALGEALRVEYETIAKAGFQLQIDDAWLPALWDRIGVKMGREAYRRYCTMRVEALNHALRNIPEEQLRYHLCWGSWHGPHAHDIPLAEIVDIMLAVKARVYLIEAANVRHEHEVKLWDEVKLPEGKMLAPGVVTHATKIIEHPELVASRLERFAASVGKENVIASTDCGLGWRCHPQIAWAKLKVLSEGAQIASARLWRT